ncbi:MAG: DOPA 4,5-dioxygenase family protein [Cyanobacteria bacterium LVE1205-1]|jgi:aromatic ring-cleaving dioxygenase
MIYHAHIYWRNEIERQSAISIRSQLAELGCEVGRVWDIEIGPHTAPMYQAVYNSDIKDVVEQLISTNLKSPVLLHESILDDLRDHTENVRWLNETLNLKLEIFEARVNNNIT